MIWPSRSRSVRPARPRPRLWVCAVVPSSPSRIAPVSTPVSWPPVPKVGIATTTMGLPELLPIRPALTYGLRVASACWKYSRSEMLDEPPELLATMFPSVLLQEIPPLKIFPPPESTRLK